MYRSSLIYRHSEFSANAIGSSVCFWVNSAVKTGTKEVGSITIEMPCHISSTELSTDRRWWWYPCKRQMNKCVWNEANQPYIFLTLLCTYSLVMSLNELILLNIQYRLLSHITTYYRFMLCVLIINMFVIMSTGRIFSILS